MPKCPSILEYNRKSKTKCPRSSAQTQVSNRPHLPALPPGLLSGQAKVEPVPSVVENKHQATRWVILILISGCVDFLIYLNEIAQTNSKTVPCPKKEPIKNLWCAFHFGRKQICLEMGIFLIWYYFFCSHYISFVLHYLFWHHFPPGLSLATALIPAKMEAKYFLFIIELTSKNS